MMRPTVLVLSVAVSVCVSAAPPAAPLKASGSIELKNAGGNIGPITSSDGDEPPLDAIGLSISSDGSHIKFVTTLKDPPARFAKAPVTVYIDTDNSATTGIKGDGGVAGGFEYKAELAMCIESSDESVVCIGGVGKSTPAKRYGAADLKRFTGTDENAGTEDVASSMAFGRDKASEKHPVVGNTVTASIDYADIRAKSGQTIRLVPEKTGGRVREDTPRFSSVLLTLK